MQLTLNTEECGGYVRYLPIRELDPATRSRAKKIFAEYRLRGVIRKGTFMDEQWLLSDELRTTSIVFQIDESLFDQNARHWIGCTSECYYECMKAYIAFQLGKYSLTFLQILAKDLRLLAAMTIGKACQSFKNEKKLIAGFLSLIPGSNDLRDYVVEELEEWVWKLKKCGTRELPDFKYYLRFNRELDSWWTKADSEEKRIYFPVYFWWHLTAILPLRATEFLTTPQDCIYEEGGKYVLTVRRTRLKKGERKLSYVIDEDYEKRQYEIPEWLFREIAQYKELTKDCEPPVLGTLLVPDRQVASGYFTYIQMSGKLKKFCIDVIGEADFPIHVGDTRHLAMINLILSGGSPVICRELAGHESIDISSNYYANLSSVVESVIYDKYHGWTGEVSLDGALHFPLSLPENRIRVVDGWCDILEVEKGDITECLKSYGTGGRIGDCRNCGHFYPDTPGLRLEIEKHYKKTVDEDGQYLMQMIELVRKGLGYQEDIGAAMLRLQGSAFRYGVALEHKNTEEKNNGKTKED